MSGEDAAAAGEQTPAAVEADADDRQPASEPADEIPDRDALAGRVAVLEAENERLREEYAHAKSTRYRQTAIALIWIGALGLAAGVLFAPARTVLFALGGTGIFLGFLTYFLAPEQFLPASVGREVFGSLAASLESIVTELGLSSDRVYVPVADGSDAGVRLYVPTEAEDPIPDPDALSASLVVADEGRGLSVRPTGAALYAEFERALSGDLAAEPEPLAAQVTDALVEQFELVSSVERTVDPESDAAAGRLTVGVSGGAYGPLERFDHPVVSVVAVALAAGLDAPVGASVEPAPNDRVDAIATYRWPYPEGPDPEQPGADDSDAGD